MRDLKTRLALVLAVAVAAATTWWFVGRDELGSGVAVEVYGDEVTSTELADRARALQALYGVTRPGGGEELDAFWRDLAKSVVLGVVLDRAADDRDIAVPTDQAEQTLAQYVARQYGEGDAGRQAFTQALGDAGSSEPAVLAEVERQLRVSSIFDDVTGDVAVPTDGDVAAAYEERKCALVLSEARTLRNVVTSSRSAADAALADLRDGADFADVARRVSQDGSTAAKGGLLGAVTKDQLERAYAAAAFTAEPGEVFGPVRTRFGWNVGLVQSVDPAHTLSLDEAAATLSELLLAERRSEAWREWIGGQLRDADVTYADDYLPDDPFSPPAGSDPSAPTEQKDC